MTVNVSLIEAGHVWCQLALLKLQRLFASCLCELYFTCSFKIAADAWGEFGFDWRWNPSLIKKLSRECSVSDDFWNNMSMLCN